MMDPEKQVQSLLSKFPELQITSEGRVRCILSGHEMPCRLDVLQSYVGGKKFSSLKMHSDFDYSTLEPFIVPSKKRRYQLFCALTNCYINKKPEELKGHISGRKYKRALEEYNTGKRVLFEERLRRQKQQEKSEDQSHDQSQDQSHPPVLDEEMAPWEQDDEEGRGAADKTGPLGDCGDRVAGKGVGLEEVEEEGKEEGEESGERLPSGGGLAGKKRKIGRRDALIKKLKILKKRAKLAEQNTF